MGPRKPRPEQAKRIEDYTPEEKTRYEKWLKWERTRVKNPNEGRTFYSETNSYEPPAPKPKQEKKTGWAALSPPEKFLLVVLGLSIFGD